MVPVLCKETEKNVRAQWTELRTEFDYYIGTHCLEMAVLLLTFWFCVLFCFVLTIITVNIYQSLSLAICFTLQCE